MQYLTVAQTTLAIAFHVLLFLVAIWDITTFALDKPGASISSITQSWARSNPIFAVAIGVLIGHLFWPINK